MSLHEQYSLVKNAAAIPGEIKVVSEQTQKIKHYIEDCERKGIADYSDIVPKMYAAADSSRIHIVKIETGEPIVIQGYSETPFTVNGIGTYRAIGKLIDIIESMDVPARIRQVTLKNTSQGRGEVFLDFAILKR